MRLDQACTIFNASPTYGPGLSSPSLGSFQLQFDDEAGDDSDHFALLCFDLKNMIWIFFLSEKSIFCRLDDFLMDFKMKQNVITASATNLSSLTCPADNGLHNRLD